MGARPGRTRIRGACALALLAPALGGAVGAADAEARPHVGVVLAAHRAASPDSTVRDATPGRPVSIAFTVANPTPAVAVQQLSVTLPDGWRQLSGAEELRIPAGTQQAVIVQVSVPSSAAAGRYAIALHRRSGLRVIGIDTALVEVQELRSLALEVVSAPALARSGVPYTVDFLLHNRGNRGERARATLSREADFALQPSWDSVVVGPGQSRPLSITVTPSGGITEQRRHRLAVVVATTDAAPGKPVLARASSNVLVVPSGRAEPDPHELPATVRLISSRSPSVVGERATSAMLELSGGGTLRERGGSRVDFLVRGPGMASAAFNEWDEYRLKLTTPRFDLAIGDLSFAPAPILGHAREGTGVQTEARLGGFALRAMGYRNRRGYLADQGLGASLQYARHGIGSLALSVMDRTGFDDGRVASLRAGVRAGPLASVDAEFGRNVQPDSGALAYRVQLAGAHRRFSYALVQRHANADYAGFAPGITTRSGRAEIRGIGRIGIRAAAGEDRSAGHRSIIVLRGTRESRYVEGGAHVGQWFSASLRVAERQLVARSDTLSSAEAMIRFSGQVHRGPLVLRAGVDAGRLSTEGDSTRRPTSRASLTASYTGRRNSVAVTAEHRVGPRWYDSTAREQLTIGLTALLRPAGWLSLRGGASASQDVRDPDRSVVSADVTIAVAPRRGHELSLRARTTAWGLFPGAEPALRLAYSRAVGIPLPGGRSGGRVIGRVYDVESGRGLANATVLVGDRVAMTDGDGRIDVSGIPHGAQYIQLDLGAEGVSRIPTVAMPLQIVTRSGAVARIDVPVVRSVAISGHVRRLSPRSMSTWDGSRDALVDSVALHGLVVRLARDGHVITRLTDAHGRFTAGDLRPGRWTIALAPEGLPAHHYAEVAELVVVAEPGQDASVGIDVLPRRRTLVLLDRADIIAADDAAGPPAPPQPATVSDRTGDRQLPPWQRLDTTPRLTDAAQHVSADGVPISGLRSLLFLGRSFYIVGGTDRTLENVALLTYGDASMWPKLWHANRHQLDDPRTVRAGTVLVVPARGPLTEAERRSRDAILHREDSPR